MKDIRIGNDISVRWSLYKGDEAYDLTNLPVTLYLKNAYGKKEIKDYTIEGNQISWTFFGKDQKNTGKYSMVLVIREGEQGMASTDYCDFVQLVSCACQVSGMDEENVQTETIELTSEVDFPPIIVDTALSESSLNPIANKAVAERFAEVEGKMALQPDWNQSDPISKDYIKNRTHGIVFHGDPRKSNYNGFLKSLTNPTIMHVGGNTIATFHTGYHSLYDYDTFLFQLGWGSTTDNILDGIIPTNRSVSVGASTSVVLNFRTFGSVTEDGEFVEHYQTTITFNDSEGWNVDEVISALCEQYCLLISEDFEIAKLDQRYIPETIARESELLELRDRIEENEVLIEDLQNTKIDKEADDYYPQLAVGLADNLSGVDVVDSEVNFRRSGGGAISDGVARIETIKGNSVVWNQLRDVAILSLTTTKANITLEVTKGSNIIKLSGIYDGTTGDLNYYISVQFPNIVGVIGHRYLCIIRGNTNSILTVYGGVSPTVSNIESCAIVTCSKENNINLIPKIKDGIAEGTEINEEISIYCTDLTQMFGSGNEPTTIEEFYARKPMGIEDENAYNEGEVIHMDVQSIESQGVNAWDEEWVAGRYDVNNGSIMNGQNQIRNANPIQVLPSTNYHLSGSFGWCTLLEYDDDKNFLRNRGGIKGAVTTSADCSYVSFYTDSNYGTTYKNDICINISDASINDKYFPYIKRTEDLSIIRKYFPQGMKSAGSAHDEIRYNKASGKWEYSKGRFRSVDLGTCDWTQDESDATRFRTLAITWKATYTNNLLCEKYATAPTQDISLPDKSIAMTNSQTAPLLRVKDSAYTDAASFKAAMQGVILYYESNDWEWVELDAEDQFKDLDYQVWNCGTEKAIAEGKSSALAADITYGFNAIGKIKELESLVAALRAKVGI